MKSFFKGNVRPLLILTILYTSSIHINKYILSVLGFTYPTVFQGWQTLVTAIFLRVLSFHNLTPMSRSVFFEHLPLFVCHVGAIVSGSKALSALPVPVVIVFSNVIPAFKYFICFPMEDNKSNTSTVASILCIFSVAYTFCADPILSEMGIASFWMILHIFFVGAQLCISDERTVTGFDKLYYSSLFSVVVLAPSSFYLEEAFEALHFQERRQLRFLLGCVGSGIIGTLLSIYSINSTVTPKNYIAVSKAISCLVSPLIVNCSLKFTVWASVIVNITSMIFIPCQPSLTLEGEPKLVNIVEV